LSEEHMRRVELRMMLVGLITLNLAVPVQAFHGGGHGGGGGGGGGGVRGGGMAGGFRGGYGGGGNGGYHGGYAAPSFNRTPSFTMPHTVSAAPRGEVGNVNRGNSFNNVGRVNNVGSVNRVNNINNVNRVTNVSNVNRVGNINNVNRMGNGWHNPYMGYHQGWEHGYWNGHLGGGWGWRPYGYGLGGFGGGLGWGLGMGLGWGLSSWMFGPMLYNWGYSNYYNPYYGGYGGNSVVAQQPIVYDYSQPINPQSPPPEETVVSQSMTTFDSAREAFKAGDYARALDLVEQALKTTPNDAALHEFRGLCLFALKRYDEAAAALYAVLSVGPGWDWTTLIGLYGDPESYTQQLRTLEGYCSQNPQSASARFVLAYQYLTQGHADAAVRQLQIVTSLQPKDQLAAQLVQQLQKTDQTAAGTEVAQGQAPPASTAPVATDSPAGVAGKLEGSWTAQPAPDTIITVTFQDKGHFAWKVSRQGKDQQFEGNSSFENGILTLVQDQNNNAMVGNVIWKDESHFTFKVVGAGQTDQGLSFTKAS
jgi:tetratricopeptide (TPR) repeat protein